MNPTFSRMMQFLFRSRAYIAQKFSEIIVWHSAMKKRQQSLRGWEAVGVQVTYKSIFASKPVELSFQNILYLQTKQDEKRLAWVFHKQYRSFAGWPSSFWIPISTAPSGIFPGLRPQVRCFPPPAAPIFQFSGCKALPCTAPRGTWLQLDGDFSHRFFGIMCGVVWLSSGLSMVGFSMVYVTLNCHPIELENDFT